MSENSFCYVVKLISLVTISIVIVEMLLICHVTSREHMFEGLCDLWLEARQCLMAIGLVQVEI